MRVQNCNNRDFVKYLRLKAKLTNLGYLFERAVKFIVNFHSPLSTALLLLCCISVEHCT
jgi:S-adenosylmethionine:tRNA-ribosyltransferase-isomerase (queuine synthetase)